MALGNFTLDLTKFVNKAKINPGLVVKKVSMDMYSRIAQRTPVDTGRARANWQLTVNHMPATAISSGWGRGLAQPPNIMVKSGDVVYITNNVEYIMPLEYGHSQQAPRGMVRVTIAEFQAYVERAVRSLP